MKKDYSRLLKNWSIIILIIIIIFSYKKINNISDNNYLVVNNKIINIEIADSDEERTHGLSGRENICEDCGLLFLFDQKDKYSFWMKDMKFPIDIIWIEDETIVYITKNASTPKDDYIPNFTPQNKADKVLEVNAGFCDKYGIKAGDKIKMLTNEEK